MIKCHNMKITHCIIFFIVLLFLSSCAAPPKLPIPPYPPQEVYPKLPPTVFRQDIYHEVAPGETLWRISKMYDVEIDNIQVANRLRGTTLKKGQELLVPDAAPRRTVIPMYKSYKWKYLIIHHTATDFGSSLSIDKMHQQRGWQGLGYHFVIDNGTLGKEDGQIEVSPRWIKQQDGAHCSAAHMNSKGIGVALVGNFSKEEVSKKQMESLIYLIDLLKEYYYVPTQNIIGHGQVSGAATECPGTNFPWQEFYSKIK